jgi:hypothetical protein
MQKDTLTNGLLEVDYLTQGGLRIVGLRLFGDERNILAELPDLGWETPYGYFQLIGGHRLWHAPEQAQRTYVPDAEQVQVVHLRDGAVRLGQVMEMPTRIRKEIEIHLVPGKAQVEIIHRLFNEGLWGVELAPWAITQLILGGVVVLPQPPMDAGLQPNRSLVLWPYTRLDDERLGAGQFFWTVQGKPAPQPMKVGYYDALGWAGYWVNGLWFVKRFGVLSVKEYPDLGANVEVYCNDRFVELETLGKLQQILPGEVAEHHEIWELSTFAAANEKDFLKQLVDCAV